MDTAFRGELRHGDHAEYTLLERKHPGERLDGSVLFATLEPCAPGARKNPKLACAERIVNARIAEVWVGIEDPDPTVDRQGIRYLEQHGIKVRLFDLDLQEQIRLANKEFIAQAFKRVQPSCQGWESGQAVATYQDGTKHWQALNRPTWRQTLWRVIASKRKFRTRRCQPGLCNGWSIRACSAAEAQSWCRPDSDFCFLGKRPRDVLHHAGLNATIEFPDGTHEIVNFDEPAILIPDMVEHWLRPKLPNVIDRSRMTREERPALPFELVREAVINALVHRDYDLTGATCHLVVTTDTITVRSPGAPLFPYHLGADAGVRRTLCITGIPNFNLLSAERSWWKDAVSG